MKPIKKKKVKSLPKLKKEALDFYARVVKLRAFKENNLRCYTCDNKLELNTTNCQLGHYLSRGGYPGLTFHPDNSRVQCYRCNVPLHGNTVEFRERLIKELGLQRVTMLEHERHLQAKWSRSELFEMIENYKSEIKELNGG